jgi:hypothetical protein
MFLVKRGKTEFPPIKTLVKLLNALRCLLNKVNLGILVAEIRDKKIRKV